MMAVLAGRLSSRNSDIRRRAPGWRHEALAGGVAVSILAAATGAFAGDVVLTEEQFNAIIERNRALENRVEQLEDKVQENDRNLEAIQGEQGRINEQIDAVKDEIPDERKLTHSGRSGVRLTLSGQVNRAVMFVDSGDEDGADEGRNVFMVDNDNSSSRFRLTAVAPLGSEHELGAQIEMEIQSNPSNRVAQDQDGDISNPSLDERKIEVWWQNPWFKLWLGQGSMASDGTAEKDLSSTSIVGSVNVDDIGSRIRFRMPNGMLTGKDIGDFFDDFDGLSRRDRVRIDTPKWHGTYLSTSYANGGDYDVALHHGYKYPVLGGLKVAAGASYFWNGGTGSPASHFQGAAVSASALHEESGLNLTFSYGEQWLETPNRDRSYYYVKGGIYRQFFDIGKTAFAVEYYHSEDFSAEGDEAHMIGAALVQHIDETATEIYAGIRNHSVDPADGMDLEDILIGLVGVRQKF